MEKRSKTKSPTNWDEANKNTKDNKHSSDGGGEGPSLLLKKQLPKSGETTNYQKAESRWEEIHQYKEKTQEVIKSRLQDVFQHNDAVIASLGKAIDFLCKEATTMIHESDICTNLIPSLRFAIRRRLENEKQNNQKKDSSVKYQFFMDHLQEQYEKLEEKAAAYGDEEEDDDADTGDSSSALLLPYLKRLHEARRRKWNDDILDTILIMAIIIGDNEVVQWLLEIIKAPPNNKQMLRAMSTASYFGTIQIIESLIQFGCPVDGAQFQEGSDPNNNNNIAVCNVADSTTTKGTALHHAAAAPHASNIVRALLKAGSEVNARRETTDETPLHIAAVFGRNENVKCLLEFGAGIDLQDMDQNTPLMCAIAGDHESLALALVELGANVNSINTSGDTPLMRAIHHDQMELTEALLKKGADPNVSNSVGPILHVALRKKQYALVERLLEHGAKARTQESDGETPLHSLCRYSDSPVYIMDLLVKAGADVNAKLENGVNPIYFAFAHGNGDMADALLEKGAELFAKDCNGVTPLAVALEKKVWDIDTSYSRVTSYAKKVFDGHDLPRLSDLLDSIPVLMEDAMLRALEARDSQMVELLLNKGYPLEMPLTPVSDTALMLAVQQEDVDSARLLLEKGAYVRCKDQNGFTCLHVAAQNSDWDMGALLMKYRPIVNEKTKDGATPLMMYLSGEKETRSLDIVQLLVDGGAAVNDSASPIFTPLHSAAYNGHTEIGEYLIEEGAEIEKRSYEGLTALLYACEQGHLDTAKMLIRNGANVNAQHPSGRTNLTHTCMHGHAEIVRLLLSNGAVFDRSAIRAALAIKSGPIMMCLREYQEQMKPVDG